MLHNACIVDGICLLIKFCNEHFGRNSKVLFLCSFLRRRKVKNGQTKYHFHVTQISRGKGQTAVSAAAYRAGEKLRDNYYGKEPDYTKKGGVLYKQAQKNTKREEQSL